MKAMALAAAARPGEFPESLIEAGSRQTDALGQDPVQASQASENRQRHAPNPLAPFARGG
jgi:hypothetical protein